ncbi:MULTISPECIES: hypothetical protein [Mycolicibacter]|uniref:Uncharacterized protein n=1 Tax=Mycolicibacter longobardus TaxID=1108812 RepID=A0A1X1YAH5_9MYCO|nr:MULTISPECIES: hypothetical protein [Mycolicibacter]ORW08066.1 hypothetical protein AWC16_20240 [Mycolicibacter longobardus]RAV04288.1 hypothetical protein DQP56_00270 [Mycolicibacter senuensis]
MTEAEAEELGRQARRDERGNVPVADPLIYAEVENSQVGEKTHLMHAFNRGWHAENAAAADEPVRRVDVHPGSTEDLR